MQGVAARPGLLFCASWYCLYRHAYTVKKVNDFPVPSLDFTYSLAGNNSIIPGHRECLVSVIPGGDGKIDNLFFTVYRVQSDLFLFLPLLNELVFRLLILIYVLWKTYMCTYVYQNDMLKDSNMGVCHQ